MSSSFQRRTVLTGALAGLLLPIAARAQTPDSSTQELTDMRIRFAFSHFTMTATLYDNPSAHDFYAMLPLALTIGDFGPNEKIAHLPRKLTEEGNGAFSNEQPYDLCYYMPWGNLAMFYATYRHPGLIRLGRFEEGYKALHERGEFPLRIEAI
ncbi:MFS transporter [Devosia sp. Root685]|uniref:cyclophilin-like fold protein n=1 Tax=Devosia sp. Root685 TaxID=1736587 RepID=UPI0006F5F6F3|nr:cyclophilin-like fold protein [Devosia sp. Root685]KRA98074.1 MFS transporter [Devosia sp. Root685]